MFYTQFVKANRYKYFSIALAGVAQWTEHRPANQGVAGLIPGQEACLGFGPGTPRPQ